ncbi:hypothetical protein SELMODRAFT_403568 [Selaginella moellendorffii]|uniref:Uncharacterized protein n=1 Tax=Selaginella moellendorffii TaxID=88036 RepID=D8QRU0_SELML|nr:hypothetical protein SELMODRAFT_403568 [Selaginella moellendorffii]
MSIVVPASKNERFAKVVTVAEGSDLFHAARIPLGVLGAVSQLTFSVQPMTKRSVTLAVDDGSLEEDFLTLAREHEFAEVSWYSSQKKFVSRIDDKAPLSVPGNGTETTALFLPVQAAAARSSRLSQEAAEAIGNSTFFCSVAKNTVNTITSTSGHILVPRFGISWIHKDGFQVIGLTQCWESEEAQWRQRMDVLWKDYVFAVKRGIVLQTKDIFADQDREARVYSNRS